MKKINESDTQNNQEISDENLVSVSEYDQKVENENIK